MAREEIMSSVVTSRLAIAMILLINDPLVSFPMKRDQSESWNTYIPDEVYLPYEVCG